MMKKVGMILFIFMILGCSSKQSLESQQFEEYYQIREQLLQQDEFEEIKDFSVTLVYNQVDNQYRYDIVIDYPQIDMYDITAMVYADENEEEMCPSLGILEDNQYHLKKGYVNKQEGFYKGIQLSGKTSQKKVVFLYVSYYLDEELTQKIEKYIEVQDEIR